MIGSAGLMPWVQKSFRHSCGRMLQNQWAKNPTQRKFFMSWRYLPDEENNSRKEKIRQRRWHPSNITTTQKAKLLLFLRASLLSASGAVVGVGNGALLQPLLQYSFLFLVIQSLQALSVSISLQLSPSGHRKHFILGLLGRRTRPTPQVLVLLNPVHLYRRLWIITI